MDLWIAAGIVMLVAWAVGTFVLAAPGWIHALLTVGVFLILYRVVVRGTRGADAASPCCRWGSARRDSPRTRCCGTR